MLPCIRAPLPARGPLRSQPRSIRRRPLARSPFGGTKQPQPRRSVRMEAVGTALVAAGALAAGYLLWRFLTADADLNLLLKGNHRPDAFQGKVVWLTGASQGLGEVLAVYLAAHGARLILSSRSKTKLEHVKAACKAAPSDVLVLPFDLMASEAELDAAAAAADAAFGGAGVDYLIHNAGASQHALAEQTTAAVVQALFDINTLGPIKLTKAALPRMVARRKGRMVVVASMAAKVPTPGQAVYSGCKTGLWGYFSSVATEVADRGVSCTLVCPGPVSTGTEDKPRNIFGPTGLMAQPPAAHSSAKITPERCAQLIANAMAHGVDECWLAKHPVLLMGYLMQYAPSLGWAVLKRVGPKRARAVSSGKSGYDVAAMLSADSD